MVTARPTIFGQSHIGRTPNVAPFNPKRSIPSDTAQVSSLANRSTISSPLIELLVSFLLRRSSVSRHKYKQGASSWKARAREREGTVQAPAVGITALEW